MNEQLKFSWGHIIAFMALIVISYISFVGITYWTDGDFAKAGVLMVVIDVVLFVFFIGAQMLKATDRKFTRCIWFERILVFGSPFVFIVAMIPYFHFWTVHSHDKDIVDNFNKAINSSKQMFVDYEGYSNERIGNYTEMLERVISNRSIHPEEFVQCGFVVGKENIQKGNMVETLRLQLLSVNYDSLKNVATEWIESSSRGASTFNVFLLGNTKEIKKAIHEWNAQLVEFATNKLSNEEFNGYNSVYDFSEKCNDLREVDYGLDGLTEKFITRERPNLIPIITAILLYFALLFPYFLQDRHTKSLYRLIGMEKGAKSNGSFTISITQSSNKQKEPKSYPSPTASAEDDEYGSFTL